VQTLHPLATPTTETVQMHEVTDGSWLSLMKIFRFSYR